MGHRPMQARAFAYNGKSAAGRTYPQTSVCTWSAVLVEVAPGRLQSRGTWSTRRALTRVLKAALVVAITRPGHVVGDSAAIAPRAPADTPRY